MKLLLIGFLLSFSCMSLACTDFSGNYMDDDSNAYSIVQSACGSFIIASTTYIADGKFRPKEETSSIKITIASTFIEDYLQVENILEYKTSFPPEMPLELIPAKFVTLYTIGWMGNLAIDTTVYNKNGDVISSENTIHQRTQFFK
jgi:hypothetical protein